MCRTYLLLQESILYIYVLKTDSENTLFCKSKLQTGLLKGKIFVVKKKLTLFCKLYHMLEFSQNLSFEGSVKTRKTVVHKNVCQG